MESVQLRTTCT